jgi:mRNA interferase RelE/StbE
LCSGGEPAEPLRGTAASSKRPCSHVTQAAGRKSDYRGLFQPAAGRAIAQRLPENVAEAVLAFGEAALAVDPHRLGKPLFGPLAGCHGARRGTYRIVYRIDKDSRTVEPVSKQGATDSSVVWAAACFRQQCRRGSDQCSRDVLAVHGRGQLPLHVDISAGKQAPANGSLAALPRRRPAGDKAKSLALARGDQQRAAETVGLGGKSKEKAAGRARKVKPRPLATPPRLRPARRVSDVPKAHLLERIR